MKNMHPAYTEGKEWKFYCEACDYGCKRRFLMNQHEKTQKHKMLKNAQKCSSPKIIENKKTDLHECKCGKQYKHQQSYRRHLKSCKLNNSIIEIKKNKDDELKAILMNINQQYKNMVIENKEMRDIVANMIPNIGNNNTTINNTVNIQVFLKEQCKDALNLTDFIDTLELKSDDLQLSKENGYAAGIANIFVRGLNALSQDKRPIHCSDLRKEVLYVKDDGVWEKENDDKIKIKNAICSVSKKQINSIKTWEEANPNWQETDEGTKNYCKMVQEVTTQLNEESENKIIKGLAKEVIIK